MAVRRLLGYVPQQLSADSGLTARENVALSARVFGVPHRERAERVAQRDAGILNKLLVTPPPRSVLITGKAFAAGVKSLIQAVVVILIAALLGVALTWNPLKLLGVAAASSPLGRLAR